MFKGFWNISFRLPAIVVLAVAVAAITIGAFSYVESSREVRRQATEELVAMRDARHIGLTQYFGSIEEDLEILTINAQVIAALTEFREAFGTFDMANRYQEEKSLRQVYTMDHRGGDRSVLKQLASPAAYQYFHTHNRHHGWFEAVTKLRGYYDLFLITPAGDVVYTVSKEKDFASNISVGEWSDTGLANAFKKSMEAHGTDSTVFIDFKHYPPSNNAPASFIARKVIHNDKVIGVLALQMPIGRINSVMQVTAGMGKTGETYVVGADHLMHTDSRFSKESTILKTRVETAAVDRALKGAMEVAVIDDYRGVPVVSAFRPFTFRGATWALLAEKDVAEIQMPINAMRDTIFFIALGLALLVAAAGMVMARSITRPLSALSQSITDFRQTHHVDDLPQLQRRDEIGEIARGFHSAAHEISEYISSINHAHEEMREGEREVREREERIRSLLEVSPIGFILARQSGELVLTNGALKKILGLPDDAEMVPDALALYRNLEDRKRYVSILKRDGAVSGYEVEWQRVDGQPVWVTISAKMIDYSGESAIMAWVDDISRRKEDEIALAAKEALLRLSFDTMSDGIYVLDADLNYLLFNQHYLDMVDLPDDAISVGGSVEKAIRSHAERGDYGEGDVEDLVVARAEVLAGPGYIQAELSIAGGGRVLELRKAPIDSGGAVVVTTDITERKRAEAEIASQRAILQATLETMDQGISMIDVDLNLTTSNMKFMELLEFPPEKFGVGTSMADLFRFNAERGEYGEGDIEEQIESRLELARKFEAHQFERTRPDGMVIEIRGNPLPGNQGFVTTYTDITDRKKAEAEIAAKESQLRMALENMPGAMVVVDSNLNVVLVNELYKEYYGDPDGIIQPGVSMRDLLKSEIARGMISGDGSPEELLEERIASYRTDKTVYFDDRTTDGRYIQLTRTPAPNGHTISVAVDITKRKRAEQETAKQKELSDTILENMDQAIYMVDGNFKFTAYNTLFREMMEIPDGILDIGSSLEDFFRFNAERGIFGDVDPDEQVATMMERACNVERYTIEHIRPDGTYVEVKRSPVPSGGLVMIISDITKRKKAEQEMADQKEIVETVLENMDQGMLMVDGEGNTVAANNRYAEILGFAADWRERYSTYVEMLRYYYEEVRDEPDAEALIQRGLEMYNTREFITAERPIQNGRFVEIRQSPLEGGGMVRTYTETTERKKAEQVIAEAMTLINDSIQYASRIQRSVLPDNTLFDALMRDYFVMWEPRDVVGGDIYFCKQWGDGLLVLLGDCTGHGVPGAFMTLIATGALENALGEVMHGQCGQLVQRLHQLVQLTLGQHGEGSESDDGMDLGLCYLDADLATMTFVGARFELFMVEDGDVSVIKGTKSGIGYNGISHDQSFEENQIVNIENKTFYMLSDGLTDQVGGDKRRMFGKKRLKELLLGMQDAPMVEHKERLYASLVDYQGEEPRRDDVSMIGFRI